MEVMARAVTNHDDLDRLHRLAQDSYDPARQCSAGHFWPARNDFDRALADEGLVVEGVVDGETVAFALVSRQGAVLWLYIAHEDDEVALAGVGAVLLWVHEDRGRCFGRLGSDRLRGLLERLDFMEFDGLRGRVVL